MPKKKTTSSKNVRQVLSRHAKASVKQATKNAAAAKKRAQQLSKNAQRISLDRQRDLLARWRALEKIGASPIKTKPTLKGLTTRNATKIRDAFNTIQNEGWYEVGRVARPFRRDTVKTAKGESILYRLTDNFKFLRTKKKAKHPQRLIKTKKGYVVPSPSTAKVKINKKGNVITTFNGMVYNDETYSGEEILELYRKVKEGEIKLNERNMVVWRPFGGFVTNQATSNQDFIDQINLYAQQFTSERFQRFMETTTFSFGHQERD